MADAMKLLPCPMCGGEAALLDYEARYGGLHYASRCPQCTSCGCSMGYLPTAKKAVEAWNCRASMPAPEKTPSFDDARRKLIHCIEQWDGETEYDAEDIAALADDILDAFGGPPAREEAPGEGAGEIEDLKAANKDHCRAVNTLTLEAIEFERQIADLRASVAKANSGFEEYERKFYLATDDVDRLKLAICGGEDVPGSINAVSVDDCERFITEERGRHIDTEARLEYVRASRDGAAGRAHDLYMALAEVKEQVVTYPLSDNSTCMCGAPLGGHNVGSGHAPVSLADHAISLIVEGIDKALRFGAPTDGRPDDYEGPDAGMHDTEIVERDND